MQKSLVEYYENDFVVSTWKLSKFFKIDHRVLKRTIQKNLEDLQEVGETEVENRIAKTTPTFAFTKHESQTKKSTKMGRPIVEYLLNEPQATYLILLLRGQYTKDKINLVKKFKKHLTQEFFRQRKLLSKIISQKQNAEWLEKRATGKIDRRIETNSIKEFIEYAKSQGSQNAVKYYMAISKMENSTLFNLELLEQKFPNIRNLADSYQLSSLQNADRIVAKALKEGIEKNLNYKEIYQIAKQRIENFSELIGKSPLMVSMTDQKLLA